MTNSPRVLAVVGTDHHPFDRLVQWVDDWAEDRDVPTLVQYGSASPPQHAAGVRLLPHDRLGDLLRDATAVVCHGGPATIADARAAGHRPLVVPRDPRHGEHVDEHQILFAERLLQRGEIDLPRGREELWLRLDAVLADPQLLHLDPDDGAHELDAAVATFTGIATAAVAQAGRRRRRIRLGRGPR